MPDPSKSAAADARLPCEKHACSRAMGRSCTRKQPQRAAGGRSRITDRFARRLAVAGALREPATEEGQQIEHVDPGDAVPFGTGIRREPALEVVEKIEHIDDVVFVHVAATAGARGRIRVDAVLDAVMSQSGRNSISYAH